MMTPARNPCVRKYLLEATYWFLEIGAHQQTRESAASLSHAPFTQVLPTSKYPTRAQFPYMPPVHYSKLEPYIFHFLF